jgi:multiple sugar transport system permease protein
MMSQAKTAAPAITTPRLNYRLRGQIVAYLFMLPALLIFALLRWYPTIITIVNSFQSVKLVGDSTWVGLRNYTRMLADPIFATAWGNVAAFAVLSILIGFMVPVILALMLHETHGFVAALVRGLVYVPTLIPIAIALLVWRQIYAPDGGMLNSFLGLAGIPAQLWLQNPALVKPAIIVIATWLGAGTTILIYVSVLQEIPVEIYEAAELDGFSIWDRIWYIALPLMRTRMQMMLVLQVIVVAQMFNEPYILTSGGPANSTVTPVLMIFRTAFDRSDFGLASAWSVSMLAILSAFSILYVVLTMRRGASAGR